MFFVGQCCLNYLLHPRDDLGRYHEQPLMKYSAKYWSWHILAANVDINGIEQIKELFDVTNISFGNWVEMYNNHIDIREIMMNSESPLQCAALHGLKHMVEWLLLTPSVMKDLEGTYFSEDSMVKNVGLDKDNSMLLEYGDALQAASDSGHKEIVQLLLERGADVNAEGEEENALQAASHKGHKEIVQLLLERGADVNAQGGIYGNALKVASDNGHKEIVQLLLERGADVNAQAGGGGNALQAASDSGHKEIVQLLLERGADVNAQGGQYGNALQAASGSGHKEIVQLLLERGAGTVEL